jgi:fructoselysine-6-P-deglycase FrlB-like protein
VNAIEAMQAEIGYQVEGLTKQVLPSKSKNCLFVGSGDSYVAGLAAQYVSGGRALCCYPTDLIQNPSLASGRNVYVISISGKTRSNIIAAKVTKRQGIRVNAITASPSSPLAAACDDTIELKYRSTGVTTAGTISFTSSMLACSSLVAKVKLPNLTKTIDQAEKQAQRLAGTIDSKGGYFILGNTALYPIAIYGALKFNEVFGAKAMPYQVEEFCHSPIFSAKKGDSIITLGTGGKELSQRLKQEGFSSVNVDSEGSSIGLLLQSTFVMQLLVLNLAQRCKITNCYFLKNSKLLRISSDFIYD